MAKKAEEFGAWRTAPDGTAHYVLEGKCLCGAKVKEFGGPPARKTMPTKGVVGKFITPLCPECVGLNIARWNGDSGKGSTPSGHEAQWWSWWQQRQQKT
jgi:hypothetical protein